MIAGRATHGFALFVALTTVVVACNESHASRTAPRSDPWSETGMLSEGLRYLVDPTFRRAALVDSLTNPENT